MLQKKKDLNKQQKMLLKRWIYAEKIDFVFTDKKIQKDSYKKELITDALNVRKLLARRISLKSQIVNAPKTTITKKNIQ